MVQSVEDVRSRQRGSSSAAQHRGRGVAARGDAAVARRDARRRSRRTSSRPTSTSRRTARSSTRCTCCTAGASRSTSSPSPRSCATAACSTRSAAAHAAADPGGHAGVGERRALRGHRLRPLAAAPPHRRRARHLRDGLRARRRRRRHARPRRGDGLRGRRAPRRRLDDASSTPRSSRRWTSSRTSTSATATSPAFRPATPTSTRSCSVCSRRAW